MLNVVDDDDDDDDDDGVVNGSDNLGAACSGPHVIHTGVAHCPLFLGARTAPLDIYI